MNFVEPFEVDMFVQSIRKVKLWDLGTERFFEQHENLIKLNQQCIVEASERDREELTRELLIQNGKSKIIVQEILTVKVWRGNILNKIKENDNSSMIIYSILYHEIICLSLISNILYHPSGCESLEDTVLDLVDYSVLAISRLISLIHNGFLDEDAENNSKDNFEFQYGLQCLTIIYYLIDRADTLQLSVISRLIKYHDLPYLLSQILYCRPWQRRTKFGFEKFIDGNWKKVQGEDILKVTKTEAQTWFALRQLILNNNLMMNYEWTDFRCREIGKCMAFINDLILDQLPPLAELKHFLCTLSMQQNLKNTNKTNFLLEEIPEIENRILIEMNEYGLEKIICEHSRYSQGDFNTVEIAKRLSNAYNIEKILDFQAEEQSNVNHCGQCLKDASKKCSNCALVYYCSRDCQIKHWPSHKGFCQQNAVTIKVSRN